MTDRRELAVVHDYEELRVALRARCETLNISRLELDRISGVANGFSAAVLSETATKRIGAVSIGPLLAALGLALVVVEDPVMMAKYTNRAECRVPNMAHLGESAYRISKKALKTARGRIFYELAILAAIGRKKIDPARRREIALKANKARWQKHA